MVVVKKEWIKEHFTYPDDIEDLKKEMEANRIVRYTIDIENETIPIYTRYSRSPIDIVQGKQSIILTIWEDEDDNAPKGKIKWLTENNFVES